MRHWFLLSTCMAGLLVLSACDDQSGEATVDRAFQDINVIDENNLNDVMLTVADPNEAVAYFQRTVEDNPDRIDIQRGLAKSFVRAKRFEDAVATFQTVRGMKEATLEDSVDLADAQVRAGEWDAAEQTLDEIPPTHETFKRYRLEAMIADSNEEWKNADHFYETAVTLTTKPAPVLNNWGYSKLKRGELKEAERLLVDAVRQDPKMFTAKNNLVLARGARRDYTLPVVPMSQTERAQLLHTLALTAIKQGDVTTGKGLLRDAVETHPQYFEPAVRALRALEANVTQG